MKAPWTLVGSYRLQAKTNGKRKERTVIGSPGGSDRHLFDRRLFLAAALLFPVIVLAGFATYYLKVLFATPPLPSALVHVHGLVMTLWVLLFIAQVRLISSNRIRLHQRTGYAGAALAFSSLRPCADRHSSREVRVGVHTGRYRSGGLHDRADVRSADIRSALRRGNLLSTKGSRAQKLMLLTAVNFLPPAVARIPIASTGVWSALVLSF